jgi:hypothetical protein
MRRLLAVAGTTAAVAALAVAAASGAAAGTSPAAGAGPAAAHAKVTTHGKTVAQGKAAAHAKNAIVAKSRQRVDPIKIVSQDESGEYVSILMCHGVDAPPPVRLNAPGTPLTLTGTGPSAAVLRSLAKPSGYKNVFTCTIVIKQRVPQLPRETTARRCELGTGTGAGTGTGTGTGTGGTQASVCHERVTLNTGFGGEARAVATHHPAR